jgi:hypothetical protein
MASHRGLCQSLRRQPGQQQRYPLLHRRQRRPDAGRRGYHQRQPRFRSRQHRPDLSLRGLRTQSLRTHCLFAFRRQDRFRGGQPMPLTLPSNPGDILVPTGVNVLANNGAVYVSAYDQSAYNPGCTPVATCITSTANPGWVFGYTVGTGGTLTSSSGQPVQGRRQAFRPRLGSHQSLCICHRLRFQRTDRLHHSRRQHPGLPDQRALQDRQ